MGAVRAWNDATTPLKRAGGFIKRAQLLASILQTASPVRPPLGGGRLISYFKLRLKLGVEEGADGPGPLDLGLCERVRDVVRPVYYDQFLGRTPERIIESPLRFSRSVGVLVAVDN